jgi:acetyltransferase-like isoleucine patch superfamily enzyme
MPMIWKRLVDAFGWRFQRQRKRIGRLVGYVYGAWLTLRYVDSWEVFPAVAFEGEIVRLKVGKASNARWDARGQLRMMHPGAGRAPSAIALAPRSTLLIERTFWIGPDVILSLREGAKLVIGGAEHEAGSGITGKSVVQVAREVTIGADCVIAWNTYITDCDWHDRDGSEPVRLTNIEPHVWIAVGAIVLKGSLIGRDSIVGANAVVTGGEFPPRSFIGGVPGRVIHAGIPDWHETLTL